MRNRVVVGQPPLAHRARTEGRGESANGAVSAAMADSLMWFEQGGKLRWLLTEPQLRAYLNERGVVMRSDVPANGRWRRKPLYDPKAALAYCETQADPEWWT